jgi:flagellar basal-body rod protein FlgB
MFDQLELTRLASAMARHSGNRMGVIARNIAGADTPGFKAQDLPDFSEVYAAESGEGMGMRATLPGHLTGTLATSEPIPSPSRGEASVDGNTVSLEKEMVKMAAVRQAHDMALSIYRATQDITRVALGRK